MSESRKSWSFTIRRWKPTSLNKLLRMHRQQQAAILKADKAVVLAEAHNAHTRAGCPIPKAMGGRREVRVDFVAGSWGAMPDGDNALKALLDGLVGAGLLTDDSFRYCRFGGMDGRVDVALFREQVDTTITLTDIGPPLE